MCILNSFCRGSPLILLIFILYMQGSLMVFLKSTFLKNDLPHQPEECDLNSICMCIYVYVHTHTHTHIYIYMLILAEFRNESGLKESICHRATDCSQELPTNHKQEQVMTNCNRNEGTEGGTVSEKVTEKMTFPKRNQFALVFFYC